MGVTAGGPLSEQMPKRPPTFVPPGQHRHATERERKAALDRTRPSRHERGYDRAWTEFRAAYLRDHPRCQTPGCTAPATEVHHLKRVKTHPHLRLVRANVQGHCKPHHSRLTALEDSIARPRQ